MQKNWNVMDSSRNRRHDHEAECVKPLNRSLESVSCPTGTQKSHESCTMSDVKVSNEDSFLSCSMMIKAKNTIMKERIWINRVASNIVFQPGIQTMALRYTTSVCDYSSRETRITPRTLPARCHKCETQWCVVEHGVKEPGAGKNTHIEVRDVVGTFFVSFHREVQCTIDYTGISPTMCGVGTPGNSWARRVWRPLVRTMT